MRLIEALQEIVNGHKKGLYSDDELALAEGIFQKYLEKKAAIQERFHNHPNTVEL